MSLRRWAPGGPRLFFSIVPALGVALFTVQGVVHRYVFFAVPASMALACLVRAQRIELVLEPRHALVRNPFRTYRIPYADVEWLDDDPSYVVGRSELTWTPRVAVALRGGDAVTIEATGWLPPYEYREVRRTIARRVRKHAPPVPDVDTRRPYDAVVALLEDTDPTGAVDDGDPDGYAYEADEIAEWLRRRDVAPEEVAEVLDAPVDEALTERLNALRRRSPR